MVNLGYVLENGCGTTRDPGEAASWYRKALATSRQGRLRQVAQQGLARLGR